MLAYPEAPSRAAEWLAAADENPERVHLWWAHAGIALLTIGTQWEVVKTDAHRGRRATATVRGPIICDPVLGHTYFLVPLGTSAIWDVAGTECLSENCWLKVPAPHCTSPPGTHWAQAPDGHSTLVDPAVLRSALT